MKIMSNHLPKPIRQTVVPILFFIIALFCPTVFSQTPTPTASPTPQVSPTPRQITDPLVKTFVERFNQLSPMITESRKLVSEGKPEAETQLLKTLEYTRSLLQELNNEILLKNFAQAGASEEDYRTLLKANEAILLGGLSNYYRLTDQPEKSLEFMLSQLKVNREILSDKNLISSNTFKVLERIIRYSEINTLFSIASVYSSNLDNPTSGLEYLEEGINLISKFPPINDEYTLLVKKLEANSYFMTANIYRTLNKRQKSIESLLKSLEIHQTLPNNERMIALLYFSVGSEYHSDLNFENALNYLKKGLEVSEKAGDKENEVNILSIIALIYEDTNKEELAKEIWQRQLNVLLSPQYVESYKSRIVGQVVDKSLQDYAIRDAEFFKIIGTATAYRKLKQYDKAIISYKDGLTLSRNYPSGIQTILSLIGNLYLEKEDWENGIKFYEQAAEYSQTFTNKTIHAQNLYFLAYGKLKSKKFPEALRDAEQSLVIYKSLDNKNNIEKGIVGSLNYLSQIHNELGNRKLAIFYGKQAVNAIQRERQQLKNLDAESQRGYLEKNEKPYRRLAGWLIAEKRIAEAEEVLRMLKEDELSEFLRRDDKVARELLEKATLDATEREALQKFDEIADEITKIAEQIEVLRTESEKFDSLDKFPKRAELADLEAKLEASNTTFRKFLEDLSSKYFVKNAKTQNNPIELVSATQNLLNDIKQPKTVIVSTIIEENRLNLIVTTSKVSHAHTVEISEEKLNELVNEFRQALQNPNTDPRPLGKELYDILFPEGLKKDLAGVNADTIVWSLDGILRYVPTAALWDGEKYLVEKYNQSVITLASRQNVKDTPTARKNLTALGVGVSKEANIPDLEGEPRNFPALPAVPEELCSIVNDTEKSVFCQQYKTVGVIAGKNLTDEQFTFENFKFYLGRYPIVHIASHFDLNPGNEGTSYMLIGGENNAERKLTLVQLRDQIGNKMQGTEILTLSACNTGMSSGTNANGEEIESFGAIAQQLGAKTVISSLWAVADPSTRDLMSEFYKQLKNNPKLGKAQAMRNAQIALLNGKYKSGEIPLWRRGVETFGQETKEQIPFNTDAKAPFAHPYYWSPFVLIGNWK